MRQPVHGPAYGDQARAHLDLREDGTLKTCEPDITRQGELRAAAPRSAAHGRDRHRRQARQSTDIVDRLARLPAVSVAAVRGRARGGGAEFALACDIRFASLERAIFAQIEVGTGLIPIGGAVDRLPHLMGRGRALEVILGSDDFDAALAERYGWINRAIPDQEFEDFVEQFARRVASFDSQSITEAKRLVTLHGGGPTPADYDESAATFYGKQPWPGTAARFPKLLELGSGKHSDLELNFGRRLGELWSEN